MEVATPAESARTEDPGLSLAKEAAEVLPAESDHRNGNQHFLFRHANHTELAFLFHVYIIFFECFSKAIKRSILLTLIKTMRRRTCQQFHSCIGIQAMNPIRDFLS